MADPGVFFKRLSGLFLRQSFLHNASCLVRDVHGQRYGFQKIAGRAAMRSFESGTSSESGLDASHADGYGPYSGRQDHEGQQLQSVSQGTRLLLGLVWIIRG